jgi:hypothetical protein
MTLYINIKKNDPLLFSSRRRTGCKKQDLSGISGRTGFSLWIAEELFFGRADCIISQVPTALLETRYIKIPDIGNYQGSLDEIIIAIEGINEKPPLGNSPPYILVVVAPFPGLNKVDTEIFNRSCELALKSNDFIISGDYLLENISYLGLSPQLVDESIDVLESEFYVRASQSRELLEALAVWVSGVLYCQGFY